MMQIRRKVVLGILYKQNFENTSKVMLDFGMTKVLPDETT